MAGKLVTTVGQRPQFLSTGLFEYPHNMAPGFFQREQSKRSKQKQLCLYDLALAVTCHDFIHASIGHKGQPLFSVEGTKGMNIRRQDRWGPSWKVATTSI